MGRGLRALLCLGLLAANLGIRDTLARAIGHLDGTGEIGLGQMGVAGWSCLARTAVNISVALYAGAPKYAGGQYVTQIKANLPREAAVGVACGLGAVSNFGFILKITADQRREFAGKRIYVHAITAAEGGADELLGNSGFFTITPPVGSTLPQQTIVLHPFSPGGDDGDPSSFTQHLVNTFGDASSWKSRYLGFVLLLNPLQEEDQDMASRIKQAFAAAKKHQIRLLIHINHEWLFGFFPEQNIHYGNLMVEQLTGIRPLGYNSYQRVNYSSVSLANVEWSSWSTPLDEYTLYWGSASVQPPRINFMADGIRNLLRAKSQVINSAITQSFQTYFGVDSHLFLGIDLGWETSVDDQDPQVPIGYGALKKLGYSAANPPANVNDVLRNVAINFLDFGASLYRPLVGSHKLFSHYLLLDQDVPFPDYNYPRWIRNPANHAWLQDLVPGFSIYCTTTDCREIQRELRQAVESQWVVTEINPGAFQSIINGFPGQNIVPPLFVTLYSFGANVESDPQVISEIIEYLANP